jgi:hypothetical protein
MRASACQSPGVIAIDPQRFAKNGRAVINKGRLITVRGNAVLSTDDTNGGNIWEIDADTSIARGSVAKLVADLRVHLGQFQSHATRAELALTRCGFRKAARSAQASGGTAGALRLPP